MSKFKKAVLIVFTLLFVMNLQFNTSLTEGMNGNFSLTQLVENVFFPSAYACTQEGNCYEGGWPYPCGGGTICIFM